MARRELTVRREDIVSLVQKILGDDHDPEAPFIMSSFDMLSYINSPEDQEFNNYLTTIDINNLRDQVCTGPNFFLTRRGFSIEDQSLANITNPYKSI